VQQFTKENHLRWDSLGEFLALAESFQHLGRNYDNPVAAVLGATLDDATTTLLANRKGPSRKVHELDNRGSHYFLARYWAQALAEQTKDTALAGKFTAVAKTLAENETAIVGELNGVQGAPVDMGGYYWPDAAKIDAAMRPSATLNGIIDGM